jgi:hypothetical protein
MSGSHGVEYEGGSLLGFDDALTVEALRTSETSDYFYETTQCHITEGCYILVEVRVKINYAWVYRK